MDYTQHPLLQREPMTAGRVESPEATIQSVLAGSYGWMFAGLLVSGAVAWWFVQSSLLLPVLRHYWVLLLAEIGLVVALSAAINRISAALATALFLLYSAVNGLTLSAVLIVYDISLVSKAFFISAGMFGSCAVIGHYTKRDLTSLGSLLFMGLIGVILASVVNWFLHSETMETVVCFIGVALFCGITAYDAQKIKEMGLVAYASGDARSVGRKAAILGALNLYLDFVNIFLYVLRILGGGKRR